MYADGGCRLGKIGAYASVIAWTHQGHQYRLEVTGCEIGESVTNNRMELMATIYGLRAFGRIYFPQMGNTSGRIDLPVFLDSQYVLKGFWVNPRDGQGLWIPKWILNGWKTSTKKDVENQDLWKQLLKVTQVLGTRQVYQKWAWVKGHDNDHWNEWSDSQCTALMNAGIPQPAKMRLFIDEDFAMEYHVAKP